MLGDEIHEFTSSEFIDFLVLQVMHNRHLHHMHTQINNLS